MFLSWWSISGTTLPHSRFTLEKPGLCGRTYFNAKRKLTKSHDWLSPMPLPYDHWHRKQATSKLFDTDRFTRPPMPTHQWTLTRPTHRIKNGLRYSHISIPFASSFSLATIHQGIFSVSNFFLLKCCWRCVAMMKVQTIQVSLYPRARNKSTSEEPMAICTSCD